ncbi:MAG: U32 family peptidase, partial [Opitutales bacterium]|nr:U32 family peptidase [Opitutales bacterium]
MPKYIPKRLQSPTCPTGFRPSVKPEILSPAGDWDCVHAAAENGADAIYFGLERFNARMRAENFKTGDLPELMAFLHRRGMRGYLTFNTLLFTGEIPEAIRFLKDVISGGVDAVIVQDAGACRLIRSLSPDLPIHASTQMSISSAAGVRFAHDLGASLAVIARECSLSETTSVIESIRGSEADMPIEIFVHGALCVAYSGQCLTSEALGGRSANRGECAQACRLPDELIADGATVPLGDRRYLLSPQDLAGISLIPD